MAHFLEIAAGIVLGFGTIFAVFWFTFRSPPSIDSGRSGWFDSDGNTDQSIHPSGHDGHHY